MFDTEDPFANIGGGSDAGTMFQAGGAAPKGNAPAFQTNKTENKYSILNMFWLINPKIYEKDAAWVPNETHFVALSFNINFGNLRVEVCNMTNESIKDQLICLNKIQRLASGTVYPTALFQLVCKAPEVICYEQIVNYDGSDWQTKINPVSFVTTSNGNIILNVGKYSYEFTTWQKEALLYSAKFSLNQGMVLSGENTIKRQ